mgnify:FL=1
MSVLLPGAGIGILGGGQLARMMVMEARRLGYRTVVLDPSPDSPGGQMADVSIRGALDDLDAAKAVASQCDVVTLDTEHVPAGVLRTLETIVPVRPSARVLAVVQDRLEQRRYLEAAGVPQVRYAPVDNLHAFETAAALTGLPGVLKTRRWGYDGQIGRASCRERV